MALLNDSVPYVMRVCVSTSDVTTSRRLLSVCSASAFAYRPLLDLKSFKMTPHLIYSNLPTVHLSL